MGIETEIPQRAFINAQIVQLVETNGNWEASKRTVAGNYGLTDYQYQNPAYIASLLYCLLVVPKELWVENNRVHTVFQQLDESNIRRQFEIANSPSQFDEHFIYNLLHKLRNAVAHANFKIDQSLNFEFWDEYRGNENFRCRVSAENLMRFLSAVGAALANIRSRNITTDSSERY